MGIIGAAIAATLGVHLWLSLRARRAAARARAFHDHPTHPPD